MTSAPRSPSSMVAYGPAHTVVRSRMRIPRAAGGPARTQSDRTRSGRTRRGRVPARRPPPATRPTSRVVLAQGGSQAPQRPTPFGQAERRPGQIDRAGGRIVGVDPEAPLVEVVHLEHLVGQVDAGERPPGRLGRGGGFGPGVGEQPRVQGRVHRFLGVAPLEGVRSGERGTEVVVVEDVEHLAQLLGSGHHRHVPVGAREHAGRDQRLPAGAGQAAAGARRRGTAYASTTVDRAGIVARLSTAEQSTKHPVPPPRVCRTAASPPIAAMLATK